MIAIPSPMREKSHPDEFPILCCLSSKPVLVVDTVAARIFLRQMEEVRRRLEKAIRIEQEAKGGDA